MSSTTDELIATVALLHTGKRHEATTRFLSLWETLELHDHFHRCVLAHYLADAQDNPETELHWDVLALEMATAASPDEFDSRFPGMTLASFFPSLHLNLAASYEKLGRMSDAAKHAEYAHQAAHALPDSPLGHMTAQAIARIRERCRVDAP